MKKNKILSTIIICIAVYVVFAAIVITLFYSILFNPIDNISVPYIRNETNIENEYGEIIHVSRYVLYKTEKSDDRIKAPYSVETPKWDVKVYVTLVKSEGEWQPVSFEVIEVDPNE